jgi:hypothetical protein
MKKLKDLEMPPQVEEIVRTLGRDLDAPGRRRFKQDLLLSYHFGGKDVACRETKSGLEIIAAGRREKVAAVLDALETGQAEGIMIVFPRPFRAWVREMIPPRSSRTR